ncbi:hypothetical protein Angca_001772, partial [Angiostrongylus cantonensis]
MGPSSAGVPMMTLPFDPNSQQPHQFTVNNDQWSLPNDTITARGTVIRGDGRPVGGYPTTSGASPAAADDSYAHRTARR